MSVFLYDQAMTELIINNIADIKERATEKRLELLEPTREEREKVMSVIKKIIIAKKRKIYGGWALNVLIKNKNPKDAFYKKNDIPDIEFYSPEPLRDLVDICDELKKNNFERVVGREAQHKETYTVFTNFEKYCDISYVPTLIYNRIPTHIIDGSEITDPSFLMIDILRALSDPVTSYWRLEKFPRAALLQKYYPIKKIDKPRQFPEKIDSDVHDAIAGIYSFLQNRETTIVIGNVAYFTLINDGKFPDISSIPYFELISTEFRKDCYDLISYLKNNYPNNKITISEYYPFFQFYGHKLIIYFDEKQIIHIYDHNHKCIPYQDIKLNKTSAFMRLGSFQIILLMLYVLFHKARVDRDKELELIRRYMIGNLIDYRNMFLKKNHKTILDNTIFKEYQIDCRGYTIDQAREYRLQLEKKKSEKHGRYIFSYTPGVDKYDPEAFKFANTSGNPIHKEINIKIKIESVDSAESVAIVN
jgi:hypothetical protein